MAHITPSEWARRQGFSRQYAHRLIQDGLVTRTDGKIDEAQANAALTAKREPTRMQQRFQATLPRDHSLHQLWLKARIKNELTKGNMLQLEAKTRQGKFIPLTQVQRLLEKVCAISRDRLLTLPDRLQHELVSITDATAIHATLTNAIREALTALSDIDLEGLKSAEGVLSHQHQDSNSRSHHERDDNTDSHAPSHRTSADVD